MLNNLEFSLPRVPIDIENICYVTKDGIKEEIQHESNVGDGNLTQYNSQYNTFHDLLEDEDLVKELKKETSLKILPKRNLSNNLIISTDTSSISLINNKSYSKISTINLSISPSNVNSRTNRNRNSILYKSNERSITPNSKNYNINLTYLYLSLYLSF